MKDELRQFIVESFLFGREEMQFSDDDSFIEKGLIDSTGVLELLAFLEEHYGVHVQDSELTPDNLDSINKICSFLEKKVVATA